MPARHISSSPAMGASEVSQDPLAHGLHGGWTCRPGQLIQSASRTPVSAKGTRPFKRRSLPWILPWNVLSNFYQNYTKCICQDHIITDGVSASLVKYTINSFLALKVVFFNELNYPVIKKTPKGAPSTDASVLEELAKDHDLPKHILKYRELEKITTDYSGSDGLF